MIDAEKIKYDLQKGVCMKKRMIIIIDLQENLDNIIWLII